MHTIGQKREHSDSVDRNQTHAGLMRAWGKSCPCRAARAGRCAVAWHAA
jgi:hypothetical protein